MRARVTRWAPVARRSPGRRSPQAVRRRWAWRQRGHELSHLIGVIRRGEQETQAELATRLEITKSHLSDIVSTDGLRMSCAQVGGTEVMSCSRANPVGGCKANVTSGGFPVTITVWYYSGVRSSLMQDCGAMSGTWFDP